MSLIGYLRVLLSADTASFDGPLKSSAEAAKKTSKDIQDSFDKIEARGGVMLFDELVGVKLPRHVTAFISSLGPVGAAMEAAFPFLVIAVAAEKLIEHFVKLKEEADKLEQATGKFQVTVNNTFNTWDDRLLEAQKKADELTGNHLGALQKELTLIDHASMKELMQTFDQLSAAVDVVFKGLESHWYNISLGSEGAESALKNFKKQYDLLLSEKKDKDATDLLAGTTESAHKAMADLVFLKDYMAGVRTKDPQQSYKDFERFNALQSQYRAESQSAVEQQIEAQKNLLEVLNAQTSAEERAAAVKGQQKANLNTQEGQRESGEEFKKAKEENREQEREDREREQAYREAVKHIQDGERQTIEATKQGTAERLAAIDAAITEENHKGLQETGYYESLVQQRIAVIKQMAEQEKKAREEAGKIAAEHDTKMAELGAAEQIEALRHKQAMEKKFDQDIVDDHVKAIDLEYKLRHDAIEKQIADLDKTGPEYQNKLNALHNKEEELEKEHQDKITQIKNRATEERNSRILSAEHRFDDAIAAGLTNVLMRHQSFGQMILSIGDQIVAGMIKNALMSILTNDMTKESDAAYAARQGWKAGMHFPFPANIVMAPLLAASGFASVMAFEKGGIIPDDTMAMVHKNEMVLPASIAQHVMSTAGKGGSGAGGGGAQMGNVHYNPIIQGNADEAKLRDHFKQFMRDEARKRGHRYPG